MRACIVGLIEIIRKAAVKMQDIKLNRLNVAGNWGRNAWSDQGDEVTIAIKAEDRSNANATEETLDRSPFGLEIRDEFGKVLLNCSFTTFVEVPDRNVPEGANTKRSNNVTPRVIGTMKATLASDGIIGKTIRARCSHSILNRRIVESIAAVERGHMIGAGGGVLIPKSLDPERDNANTDIRR